ncbi:MAG: hypothetical protein A4E47_01161 [Methanosaeta sp. PtaU1.Bin028]|nr:MAG: hypothetical protein A4E47_01161 [Methanosaeta sp. PtaU1.Bin028]
MEKIAGWDGPTAIKDGSFRYQKAIGWSTLCIECRGQSFVGRITGCGRDCEIAREDGLWKRFSIDVDETAGGDVRMLLVGGTTLQVVMVRTGEQCPLSGIATLHDLARYMEWWANPCCDQAEIHRLPHQGDGPHQPEQI